MVSTYDLLVTAIVILFTEVSVSFVGDRTYRVPYKPRSPQANEVAACAPSQPQTHTAPVESAATLCVLPAAIETNVGLEFTAIAVGVKRCVKVPSPNWPLVLSPHA